MRYRKSLLRCQPRVGKNTKINFEAHTYGQKTGFYVKIYVLGDGESKFEVKLRLILLQIYVLIVVLAFWGVNWDQKLRTKD